VHILFGDDRGVLAMTSIKYNDRFVRQLAERIEALIDDGSAYPEDIRADLLELAAANSPAVADYWKRTQYGMGIPDAAFKDVSLYLFPDEPPARVFQTSGTTGSKRGQVAYTARGLNLMKRSVVANARPHFPAGRDRPVILRFVPTERSAPHMAMACHQESIAAELGDPELSAAVVTPTGVELRLLAARLDAAIAADRPVVLIGGSFAFVNVCDALQEQGRSWSLPAGSRLMDGGGFKGRSRVVTVEELRAAASRVFGIADGCFVNMFGMTELANQLYDAADLPVGPLGERPKGASRFIRPIVRDPFTLQPRMAGIGLLEVADMCVLDRPNVLLTGDQAVACPDGVAIAGRIPGGPSRGCSLTLDEMTAGRTTDG